MSTSELSTACPPPRLPTLQECAPELGLLSRKTSTHRPAATPGTVAAALLGYPLTAASAGHGFCCWLCHGDRPDWQGMSLLVAGQPQQQWLRQPPAVCGPRAQPCCSGQRGELMGHRVSICVPQPRAVTALLEAKAVPCLSCHSWDRVPAAPNRSETPPATAAALLPHLPCPAQWDEGPGLL